MDKAVKAAAEAMRNYARDHGIVRSWDDYARAALTAHEAELAAERAENARLRIALASIVNRINVEGSPWHEAQVALDKLVVEIKREARAALTETQPSAVEAVEAGGCAPPIIAGRRSHD